MKLYLDDIRPCPVGCTYAQNVEQAIAAVTACLERNEEWTHASLDHDLAEEHYRPAAYGDPPQTGTGMDFVDWMIRQNCWPTIKPVVHSANPVGAARMRAAIERYFPRA